MRRGRVGKRLVRRGFARRGLLPSSFLIGGRLACLTMLLRKKPEAKGNIVPRYHDRWVSTMHGVVNAQWTRNESCTAGVVAELPPAHPPRKARAGAAGDRREVRQTVEVERV